MLGLLLGLYMMVGFVSMFAFADPIVDDGPNIQAGFCWPVIMGMVLGSWVWEFGIFLGKVLKKFVKRSEGRSEQAKLLEKVDPRRVRFKYLLAEREKLTTEIIALREEFEKEMPLYRGNMPGDLQVGEISIQREYQVPRQANVNWPFVEELLGRPVDEKWKRETK